MKIIPLGNVVQLKVEKPKAGVLDTSSRMAAVEYGEVVAVGPDVKELKGGDRVFFKSWATDHIDHEDKHYVFINVESGGILAIFK